MNLNNTLRKTTRLAIASKSTSGYFPFGYTSCIFVRYLYFLLGVDDLDSNPSTKAPFFVSNTKDYITLFIGSKTSQGLKFYDSYYLFFIFGGDAGGSDDAACWEREELKKREHEGKWMR